MFSEAVNELVEKTFDQNQITKYLEEIDDLEEEIIYTSQFRKDLMVFICQGGFQKIMFISRR